MRLPLLGLAALLAGLALAPSAGACIADLYPDVDADLGAAAAAVHLSNCPGAENYAEVRVLDLIVRVPLGP